MKLVYYIFDQIVVLLSSVTFWTAIGAFGTVGALYFIYKQISNARDVAGYEFLRREDDRFRSGDMLQKRHNLAKVLILNPDNFKQIDAYADFILDYFEDLGLLLRKKLVSEYFVWTMNCYHVIHYWVVLTDYINWVREDRGDPTYYCEFEYLYKKMLKFEKKMTKKKIEFTSDDLREFLEEELCEQLRPFSLFDLDRIMEIEESSFKEDAYTMSQFKELFKEHPDGFYVAEILGKVVGYVIGYVSDDIGEFDSLAVDSHFRHLGIGRRLTERVIEDFRKKGVKMCSLEVRTTNESAIHFYKSRGFEIVDTLKKYYDDGGDAFLMRRSI